jgi:hypothetical protein
VWRHRARQAESKLAEHLAAHTTGDAHDCAFMEEELQRERTKLARVVEALEQIVAITPDVAQEKTHVVAIKRLAEAALAAAREQPTQEPRAQRTFRRSDGTLGCGECCNGDRCDDGSHFDRKSCPFCGGTGDAKPTQEKLPLGHPFEPCGQTGPGEECRLFVDEDACHYRLRRDDPERGFGPCGQPESAHQSMLPLGHKYIANDWTNKQHDADKCQLCSICGEPESAHQPTQEPKRDYDCACPEPCLGHCRVCGLLHEEGVTHECPPGFAQPTQENKPEDHR